MFKKRFFKKQMMQTSKFELYIDIFKNGNGNGKAPFFFTSGGPCPKEGNVHLSVSVILDLLLWEEG